MAKKSRKAAKAPDSGALLSNFGFGDPKIPLSTLPLWETAQAEAVQATGAFYSQTNKRSFRNLTGL